MKWTRRLRPDAWIPEITALDAAALYARGFRGLILDLDNTLTEWNHAHLAPVVEAWLRAAEAAGLRLCILSNNGLARVEPFARGAGVPAVARAGKPRRGGYRRALALLRTAPERTAVVGDQVWTDVWGARRMNMYSILVQPIAAREFAGTRAIRWLERAWVARLRRQGLDLPAGSGRGTSAAG